MIETFKCE